MTIRWVAASSTSRRQRRTSESRLWSCSSKGNAGKGRGSQARKMYSLLAKGTNILNQSCTREIENWTNPAPQIRNPKSPIGLTVHSLACGSVHLKISYFGFEMQDLSNFKIPLA